MVDIAAAAPPEQEFFDVHCHVFSLAHVPKNKFFQDHLDQHGADSLADLLRDHFGYQGLSLFVRTAARSTEQIFLALQEHYRQAHPRFGWRFVPLMVDLATLVEPTSDPRATLYEDQLEDLLRLKLRYPALVFPFLAVDPRKRAIARTIHDDDGNPLIDRGTPLLDVVRQHVGNGRWLHGIKVYPTFGFEIYDDGLDAIFGHCQDAGIPVTMHCGRDGALAPTAVLFLDAVERLPQHLMRWSDASNPDRAARVLNKFPRLRFNFAHFGGEAQMREFIQRRGHGGDIRDNWVYKIANLLRHIEYPNVYTDISGSLFASADYATWTATIGSDFSEIKHKILYGSDFFLSTLYSTNPFVYDEIRRSLFYDVPGDHPPFSAGDVIQLARDNARAFLFG